MISLLYVGVLIEIRYGVMANIAAFHAAARGSIPRIGTFTKSASLENICQLFWQM